MMSKFEQEELHSLMPADEFYPTLSQDDDLFTGHAPSADAWEVEDKNDAPEDDNLEIEASMAKNESETDNLVAHYLGDVRQFRLLSFAEERAVWAQIERRKARLRRVLCITPGALEVMTGIWQQVERAEIPLRQVVCNAGETQNHSQELIARLGKMAHALRPLRTNTSELRGLDRTSVRSVQKRRRARREMVRRWHQWIETWEALGLHPKVYEAIQCALEGELQAKPDDPGLRAAHTTVLRVQRALEQAKAQMMQANLRLVIHVANRYRNRGIPFLDLIQEGNLGLMRALDKFEPQRGLKFVTYAHWWIRQAISRAIAEQQRTVRLPSHIIERKSKLRAAGDRLWDIHGRAPSVQELGVELGWTAKGVEDLLTAVQPITRLQQPLTDEGSMLMDLLEDEQATKPEELVAEEQLQRRMTECLASLTEREAFILRQRYGLGADHPHTLQEIASILGLSRERVRQLEKQAFEKLRKPQWSILLADFADVA
jgi:RNA polymerase sigma factor (sigma-70 family)